MKTKRGQKFAEQVLGKWIKYAQGKFKSKFHHRVVLELDRLEPESHIHRQQVQRWLHPDAEQRQEPGLGMGLMLVKACEQVARKQRQSRDADA
jgi:hypothetical protein